VAENAPRPITGSSSLRHSKVSEGKKKIKAKQGNCARKKFFSVQRGQSKKKIAQQGKRK